jgi:hypothetical protein
MRSRLDLLVHAQFGRYVGKGVMWRGYHDEQPACGKLTAINDCVVEDDTWLFEIDNERIYEPVWFEGVSKE